MDEKKLADVVERVGEATPILVGAIRSEKSVWKSKTQWAALVTALAPLVYPPAAVWIAANPAVYSAAIGALFGGLRLVTKDRIYIK